MIEIIPAIMPEDLQDLHDKAELVAPYVRMVQLDIMDGRFVKSKTWPYFTSDHSFEKLLSEDEGLPLWEKIDFEIDLMIDKPETVLDDWITAGAKRLIIHIESTKNMNNIIKNFRQRFAYSPNPTERSIELVLAKGIETPIDAILPYLEDIDGVQFMGIAHIGYQGEELDERVIDTMREFHIAHPEVILSVDGGVTLDNARILTEAGARRLVSGSGIYKSTNIQETIELFKNINNA
jgi:ribulose-phosphate 3-epimerase